MNKRLISFLGGKKKKSVVRIFKGASRKPEKGKMKKQKDLFKNEQ